METMDRPVKPDNTSVLLTNGIVWDKMNAHRTGREHYACSVLIFNANRQMLLQKRADCKYHSGGLWTNACCTHPLSTAADDVKATAEERLAYEMGIECSLSYLFSFSYEANLGNGLIENEFDFVYIGCSDSRPVINPSEVGDFKWATLQKIEADRRRQPNLYTQWFHIMLDRFAELIEEKIF